MRQALQHYLGTSQPKPKAIFVGIRRNDPHWLARESDRTYNDIWNFFLIKSKIPHCSIYDEGFTSPGSMENTHPNLKHNGHYSPAFVLKNKLHEQCRRVGLSRK
ncbi:hypothetical protein BC941DRAFT_471082 [Chlamydoabsidia padenii]|nr:hypothetical protein BC941DRAFT_471082 [Chlamydoabsidia padenii]